MTHMKTVDHLISSSNSRSSYLIIFKPIIFSTKSHSSWTIINGSFSTLMTPTSHPLFSLLTQICHPPIQQHLFLIPSLARVIQVVMVNRHSRESLLTQEFIMCSHQVTQRKFNMKPCLYALDFVRSQCQPL